VDDGVSSNMEDKRAKSEVSRHQVMEKMKLYTRNDFG
jgi:hypothetical protein